jgi:hypothetical protein
MHIDEGGIRAVARGITVEEKGPGLLGCMVLMSKLWSICVLPAVVLGLVGQYGILNVNVWGERGSYTQHAVLKLEVKVKMTEERERNYLRENTMREETPNRMKN